MIDIQCLAHEPYQIRRGELSRCQLAAGHEGDHALMFYRSGHRVVRTWSGHDLDRVGEHLAGQENLPWVRGMPLPAWFEHDPPTTDGAGRPRAGSLLMADRKRGG